MFIVTQVDDVGLTLISNISQEALPNSLELRRLIYVDLLLKKIKIKLVLQLSVSGFYEKTFIFPSIIIIINVNQYIFTFHKHLNATPWFRLSIKRINRFIFIFELFDDSQVVIIVIFVNRIN